MSTGMRAELLSIPLSNMRDQAIYIRSVEDLIGRMGREDTGIRQQLARVTVFTSILLNHRRKALFSSTEWVLLIAAHLSIP